MGEANLVDGILDDDAVETILGSLPVHSGTRALRPGKVTVLARPEQIDTAQIDTPQIDIGARNGAGGLAGRIVACGYHGHDAVVHVVPDSDSDSEPAAPAIVVRTLGGCALPAGAPVTLHARGPVLAWNQ